MSQEPLPNPEATLAHYQAQAGMAQLLREKDLEIERWKSLAERLQAQADVMRSVVRQYEAATTYPDGWRPVPLKSLLRICALIDPEPIRLPNGDTMVFKNPHAGAALREISLEFRAMLATAPAPTNGDGDGDGQHE